VYDVKKASLVAAIIISGVLASCANRPESIRATYVPYEKYAGLNCIQLATRLADENGRLAEVSRKQDGAANADAVGVFLVGIPVSKLSGDHEADVSKAKGEVDAIGVAQIRAKCKSV
jgi:hypothetical protein